MLRHVGFCTVIAWRTEKLGKTELPTNPGVFGHCMEQINIQSVCVGKMALHQEFMYFGKWSQHRPNFTKWLRNRDAISGSTCRDWFGESQYPTCRKCNDLLAATRKSWRSTNFDLLRDTVEHPRAMQTLVSPVTHRHNMTVPCQRTWQVGIFGSQFLESSA